MKKIITASILLVFGLSYAQDVPDQNPNYQKSKDYYMKNHEQYTSTQGTTDQQTYTPFVETTRLTLRHERQMARIESRQNVQVARANRPVYRRGGGSYFNQGFNSGFRNNRRGFGVRPYANTGIHWGRNGFTPYWDLGLGWGY